MYIDLNNGTIQFGSDTEFYGTAFNCVQITDGPLYPIVTAAMKGAIIAVVYRGQGKAGFTYVPIAPDIGRRCTTVKLSFSLHCLSKTFDFYALSLRKFVKSDRRF